MVVLWTDALIYLLIVVMLALGLYLRGKEHIKRPLQQIGSSKIGMISLVVLLFFVLIGLLDSVHFKPADDKKNEIVSLLDDWATPLREHGEKTYSAPFAITLYSKEMMMLADGSIQWGYPRLEFGGRHLDDPETQRIRDILQKGFYGLAQGVGLTGLFMMLYLCIPMLRRGNTVRVAPAAGAVVNPSTKAVWLVLFIIVPLATTLIHLSAYYHVFGTDKVGEDVFYQAVKSIRTGLVIGTLTTLIMLPMAIIFGILAGFFSRLGGRRHPIRLHHAQFHSRRVADRRLHPDGASVHGQSRSGFYQRHRQGRYALAVPMHDPRRDQLDRLMPVASGGNPQAQGNGIRPGRVGLGSQARCDFTAPHPAQCDAHRADLRGAGFQFAGAGRSGIVLYQYRRRSDQLQLGQYD